MTIRKIYESNDFYLTGIKLLLSIDNTYTKNMTVKAPVHGERGVLHLKGGEPIWQ